MTVRLRPLRPDEYPAFVEVSRREYSNDLHQNGGLGRAAMVAYEQAAREQGFERLELNVFGGNERARGLYRSLGFTETAVNMAKQLSPDG